MNPGLLIDIGKKYSKEICRAVEKQDNFPLMEEQYALYIRNACIEYEHELKNANKLSEKPHTA